MSASLWLVPLPQILQSHANSRQITPNIPDGANPDHYMRIRAPRRRNVANESTVTLRKNKTFSALVEHSYVRLDWVWEVPFAILLAVPRAGIQLMLRAVSIEKIMSFYSSMWGWDGACGQTYRSLPEGLQSAGYCHDQNTLGPPESIRQGGEAGYPHMTPQPYQAVNGMASSGIVEQDRDSRIEALAGSDSTRSWDMAYRSGEGENIQSERETPPCARQEMVFAGDAHCAMLAKLLQEAR